MYAPLPEGYIVCVRPPRAWVRLGVVAEGTIWTLHKAVYGLRCAPRMWGLERDKQFRAAMWSTTTGKGYRLVQCSSDSQCWESASATRRAKS